jgi:hypothetical protein
MATRSNTSASDTPRRAPRSGGGAGGRGSGRGASTRGAASRGSGGARSSRPDAETFRLNRLETSRYGIVYDIDGPRVRLGVVWFVVALAAAALGTLPLAVVVAAISALAAAQVAKTLRAKWCRPSLAVSAVLGAVPPLAATRGTALAGASIIVLTLVAVAFAAMRQPRRTDPIVDAGAMVRAGVFVALAATWLVVLHRAEIGAAITLLLVASAYEVGDYLIGSGSTNVVEGPLSGVLAIIVVAGALALVVQPPPFTSGGLWLYAAVAAATIPLGQVAASTILPRAGAPAPALRRLDSYLLSGVAWLVLLAAGVGTTT